MVSKSVIESVLRTIPDPEIGVSLWDLGLIYEVNIDKVGNVRVVMTLTTMGCPLFSLMEEPIKQGIASLPGVKSVVVDLTFDPPWTIDRMSKKAKKQLCI